MYDQMETDILFFSTWSQCLGTRKNWWRLLVGNCRSPYGRTVQRMGCHYFQLDFQLPTEAGGKKKTTSNLSTLSNE